MGRERRPYTRTSEVRDAKLFVIAAEGQKTEIRYFKGIKGALASEPTRIHIKVLERENSNSSPRYLLDMVNEFVANNKISISEGDEVWLAIDRDAQSWGEDEISAVAQECIQKQYGLALSNPCFEVWLLLHFHDVDTFYSQEQKDELFANKRVSRNNTVLKSEVSKALTSLGAEADISKLFPFVKDAIERAKALDSNLTHRWPVTLGTRVYLLVERILAAS
jgi:hypothetical protein